MGWNGMKWDEMGWNGMKWDEMGWNGMKWDEMGWNGMKWDEMGWNGMKYRSVLIVIIGFTVASGKPLQFANWKITISKSEVFNYQRV